MYWNEFLFSSVAVLLVFIILAIVSTKTKKNKWFTPIVMLTLGVVLSAALLYIPILYQSYKEMGGGLFETIFDAIFMSINLFGFDGELGNIMGEISHLSPLLYKGYIALFTVIYILAPFLTVGIVLSFFNDISSYIYYIFHFNSQVYVFSELNEKSYLLAKSIANDKDEKPLIIFANVVKDRKKKNKLLEKAIKLGALYFKKDIAALKLGFHNKNKDIKLFTINEDENKNINLSFALIRKYKEYSNAYLYIFSTSNESEYLFLNSYDSDTKLKVRRVDVVNSLISRTIYEDGYKNLFMSAYEEGGTKHINALVVGVGVHGTEIIKTLPWVCQMDGYRVKINAFDIRKNVEQEFTSLCPELMKFSGKEIDGEALYDINIHSNVNVDTLEFDTMCENLSPVTYVFIDVGDDDKNISIAIKLRTLFARKKCSPVIQAIVHNSNKKKALVGITNHRKQQYDIDFIGDLEECYSKSIVLNSSIEQQALGRHLKWGEEKDFWQYSYNYESSIASVIHKKLKMQCGIAGVEKTLEERTEEEKQALRILEHRRWNAYVRSRGYVYGGTTDKSGRNDMAKTHNCLVPFGELPLEEQLKDDD